MIPTVIALKLNRRILQAGVTLSQIAGAFVAQLSTRANPRPEPRAETLELLAARIVARSTKLPKAATKAKRPGISRKSPRIRTRTA